MPKVTLSEKFSRFSEHWSPKIVGEVNDSYVKLVKFQVVVQFESRRAGAAHKPVESLGHAQEAQETAQAQEIRPQETASRGL